MPPTTELPEAQPPPPVDDAESADRPPMQVTWQTIEFDGETGPRSGSNGDNYRVAGDGRFLVMDSSLEEVQRLEEGGGSSYSFEDADGDPRTILWMSSDGVNWESKHLNNFEGLLTRIVGDAHGHFLVAVVDGDESYVEISADLDTWTRWPSADDGFALFWVYNVHSTTSGAIILIGSFLSSGLLLGIALAYRAVR